ncbi:alkaline phosphatase-like protein [Dothidotthia symphoricarpi CBS 119687]|uniref:Alkaline phosphatase n=1 Tax=Dothidotthia symphoricarpi CBS 119687 TaxID=1392245 RepID=A0A6A5ZYB7_9PLEO|nr:alkaline phosphatase-like protein [Dothidotthia symphoricarpi CBS 119687]KAF2124529.1 alkaline phosphatase-like protein [Dothidotthia symphoricarpi CBS 119687]
MSGTRPLLSDRTSSERDIAEEDALLTGQPTQRPSSGPRTWTFWREIGLFVWAVVATALVIVLAVVYQRGQDPKHSSPHPSGKRNLIFMVSDGMGPTSLSLTRSFMQFQNGAPYSEQLVIDQHLIGQSRTRSSSSLITDSAAGATAFSCALKSYNSAISVTPDHEPCGTVLEAAKKAGYMTGLVVTTRITDATPACFAAHVNMRMEEDRIAEQMVGDYPLGRVVDLMFGGGRCHFLPNSSLSSCRADDKDVVELAKKNGFNYISDRESFDNLKGGDALDFPMLGLFADTDIPYELDRRNENDIYPSLHEMAEAAMKALSHATKDSDKGFFLMIEGSRIDHAGHHNDPAAQVHEVLAYDKTFTSVLDFLKNDKTEAVMVSTSDHETGGLAAARQLHTSYPEYLWHPSPLANATHSAERLHLEYTKYLLSSPSDAQKTQFVRASIATGLGIADATDDEVALLVANPTTALYYYADMMSRRSQTGWSTHGHSAADVNIYTSDPVAAKALVGNHENTEVGGFLRDYLGVDVEAVTKELREKGKGLMALGKDGEEVSWMGAMPEKGQRLDGQTHLASYEGDFKKRGAVHGRACDCGH